VTSVWRQGLARYDGAALCPPEVAGRPTAEEQATFDALRCWCLAAAPRRLAMAALDAAEPAAASRLAALLALERDGSWQLEACGSPVARLQLRVLTQLRDVTGWGTRRDSHPWDSGTLRDTAAGLQALTRFTPRRATLIVADRIAPIRLQEALASLSRRSPTMRHPVCVLIIGAAPTFLPAGALVEPFRLPGTAA
jgi:hypothetical protein